jgi:hypothetical protein
MRNIKFNKLAFAFSFFLVIFIFSSTNVLAENKPPVINTITIDPQNPTKYQTLVCTVEVYDEDGNLDYVDFHWYRNGVPVRESTKAVYGKSDTAFDTLDILKNVGDYIICEAKVYDFERAYDREIHAVRVGNLVTNSAPSVTYVDITPRHPNPQQDLTCSVLATDTDDNLDYVIIEWYKNDRLIRSAAKDIEGSSDTAYDILTAGYTSPNDWIKCKAIAYDTYNAKDEKQSLPVVISGESYPYYPPSYLKPIAVLSVNNYYPKKNEMVLFSGYGSYDPDGGSIVQYLFDFGDGSQSAWLPAATPYAYHAYNEEGIYYARLKVKDDEQQESDWSPPIAIRVGGVGGGAHAPQIDDMTLTKKAYTNYVRFECKVEAFDKDGDLDFVRFKWYINDELVDTQKNYISGYNDETSSTMNLLVSESDTIKCEAIVYDQEHNSVSAVRTTSGYAEGETCAIAIKRFDYYSYLMEGSNAWVETEIENTGTSSKTLTIKLYVDNSLKEEYTTYLQYGRSVTKRFEFPLSVGSHKIRIEAYLPCTSKLNKTTEITIFPRQSSVFIPSQPNVTEKEWVDVVIIPKELDMKINSGDVINIRMFASKKTKFKIYVENLPDDWVSYNSEVDVEGSDVAYIYLVPKSLGTYTFSVKVVAGEKTFEESIKLYVAPLSEETKINGFSGLISVLQSNWLSGLVILAVLLLLVILYFLAGRMKKKSYEETVYKTKPLRPEHYGRYPHYSQTFQTPYAKKEIKHTESSPPSIQKTVALNTSNSIQNSGSKERLFYKDGSIYPKFGSDFLGR